MEQFDFSLPSSWVDPKPVKTKALRDFLNDLRRTEPVLYGLAEVLAVDWFAIRRTRDHRNDLYLCAANEDNLKETYTLRQFLAVSRKFHPHDQFEILIGERRLFLERHLTAEDFGTFCRETLWALCEERMRDDNPLRADNEPLCRLAPRVRAAAAELVDQCNADVVQLLQAEYDALKGLRCINN